MTARSEEKGQRIVKSILDPALRKFVSYVIVGNISDDGAFDEVSGAHGKSPPSVSESSWH